MLTAGHPCSHSQTEAVPQATTVGEAIEREEACIVIVNTQKHPDSDSNWRERDKMESLSVMNAIIRSLTQMDSEVPLDAIQPLSV